MAAPTSSPKWRWGHKFLLTLLGFIGLTIVLLTVLPYIFSLDSIKQKIITQVENRLNGRKVELGKARLQILTGIGVSLEQPWISNPSGWQQPYFVKLDTLSVKVALWPLLQRNIEVSKLILSNGQINVERNSKGELNYSDLAVLASETSKPLTLASPDISSPLTNLLVSKVTLQNVDIAFIDQLIIPGQTHTTTAKNVQVNLSNISLETPIAFDIATALLANEQHNVRLKGTIGPLPASLVIDKVPLQVTTQVDNLELEHLTPYMGPEPAIKSGQLNINITAQGSLNTAMDINGVATFDNVVLSDKTGTGNSTALPKVTLTQNATVNLAKAIVQLTDVRLDVAGLQAMLKGTVQQFNTTPDLDLQLNTTTFNLGDVLSHLPMLTEVLPQPSTAQGSLQLQTTIKGTLEQLQASTQVKAETLSLKGGTFHGAKRGDGMLVELANMETSIQTRLTSLKNPDIQLDFTAKHLVFNQQSAAVRKKPSASPSPSGKSSKTSPRSILPPITLKGKIKIDEGQIKTFPFQNFAANLSLIKSLLNSTQSLETFEGTIQSKAEVNFSQITPDYNLYLELTNLNAGKMANTLTSMSNIIFGLLNINMTFSSKGLDWNSISKSLTGKGKLELNELELASLDVMPKLATGLNAVSVLTGFTIPTDLADRSFNTMKASLRIKQGKVYSDNLRLLGPGIKMIGQGFLGLDQSLQFDGTALLFGKLVSDFGKQAAFLHDKEGRIQLPLAIKGTVTKPQITLSNSLVELTRKSLTSKVKKAATKELRKLLDKVLPGLSTAPDAGKARAPAGQNTEKPIKKLKKSLESLLHHSSAFETGTQEN